MDRRTDCPERTASRDMFPQPIPLFNEKFRPVPCPMIKCSSKPRACANPVLYHQASISGDATGTKTTRTIRPNFATQQTDSGIGDLRPQASEERSFHPAPSQKYPPSERYRSSTIRDVASGDSRGVPWGFARTSSHRDSFLSSRRERKCFPNCRISQWERVGKMEKDKKKFNSGSTLPPRKKQIMPWWKISKPEINTSILIHFR